jgi:hypothetical protein
MAVHHVEMPLVDRQIDRLANRAAGMVQGVGEIGELDEIAEILDAGIAAAFVEIAYERRTIGRSEHRVLAADHHAARGVARVLSEFSRGTALHERTAHTAGKMHALALDIGTGGLPDFERLGIVAKIDADLFENGVGVVFHQREAFLAQDLVERDLAGNVGNRRSRAGGAGGPFRIAAAGTPCVTGLRILLVHRRSPSTDSQVWSLGMPAADQFASWTCHDAPFSTLRMRRVEPALALTA